MRTKRILTPDQIIRKKEFESNQRKRAAAYKKSLSPEALKELKQNRIYDKERREKEKKDRADRIQNKKDVKRELAILNFMLKSGVKYLHHGQVDYMTNVICAQIEQLKKTNKWKEYDPYIWNRQGEGNDYMSRCLLGCIFSRTDGFNSIYDVPLDGTYKFHVYDSGERGSGSFNRITATKVEVQVQAPYVNPGAIIPITVN